MTTAHLRALRLSGTLRAKGHTLPDDVLVAEWKAVDRAKMRAADLMAADVAPVLARAYRRAADVIRAEVPAKVDDVTILQAIAVDMDAVWDDLAAVLPASALRAVRAGWASGLIRIEASLPFDAERPVVTEAVRRLVELSRSVPETLRGRVGTVIADGLAAGRAGAEIADLLLAAAPEMTATQAALVGRTTATAAFEAGQVESFAAAGVEMKRWLSMRDDRVRDEHAALDGEEVPVGAAFSNGEDYPSSFNCRCTTLPVVTRKAVTPGRPWLAARNAEIIGAYPDLRDAKGREVALAELGERHSLSPDRVWAIWKARAR